VLSVAGLRRLSILTVAAVRQSSPRADPPELIFRYLYRAAEAAPLAGQVPTRGNDKCHRPNGRHSWQDEAV